MILYRKHFEDLTNMGALYNINTSVVEKRSFFGVGGAYSNQQTGMMNSGIEDDITFPLEIPAESENLEFLKLLLSYRHRYDVFIGQRADAYYKEVLPKNLPGAVMFKRSLGPMSTTANGQLEHERAYLMRGTVGEEEYNTFDVIRKLAENLLPFYKLRVLPSKTVEKIAIEEHGKPVAVIRSNKSNSAELMVADQMRLNTGTTVTNPVSDKAIRNLTFCQAMNVDHFKKYCSQRGLLDQSGRLIPGSKMLSGGVGLSGLDQISVLDGVMNLFEIDDSELLGYKVTQQATEKYKGAITLMSRTPGKSCYPRHTLTAEWLQGTPVMAASKHLHSLFLHGNGEQVFSIWNDIMVATVARATNVTPAEAKAMFSSTEETLKFQFQESQRFLESMQKAGEEEKRGNMEAKEHFLREATKTTYGAWRQAALCLIFGFGIEENLEKATEEMEAYAPHTWKGRQGWLYHRAQVSCFTDPEFSTKSSNMNSFKNWEWIMNHVTSSPVEIHSMFHLLLEAGIAKYEQGSYSDVHPTQNGEQLSMKEDEYDALLVSPVFERQEDGAVQSLAGLVKPYHADHPNFGRVGRFRRFQDQNGEFLPIEDNGLGGKGFNIKTETGETSRAGCFAVDLNNRASGVSVGSSFTMRRMALSHLRAAGIENAERVLDNIYDSGKSREDEFNDEVRKFETHFEEVYEIWAYIKAIEMVAGDDVDLFQTLYDSGLNQTRRMDQIRKMKESKESKLNEGAALFEANLKEIPVYQPPARDAYLERFVDTTEDEDRYLYNEAFNLAKKHLQLAL